VYHVGGERRSKTAEKEMRQYKKTQRESLENEWVMTGQEL